MVAQIFWSWQVKVAGMTPEPRTRNHGKVVLVGMLESLSEEAY
jgi:hypothetical protein